MAAFLWGKVFIFNQFVGYLRQEPGERYSFTYDASYLNAGGQPIAYTLPLQAAPFVSEQVLPAFFDNLVSEGWLQQAQMRLLGKRHCSRFELLLAFGRDCAGAVSVIDPEMAATHPEQIDPDDKPTLAPLLDIAEDALIIKRFDRVAPQQKYHFEEFSQLLDLQSKEKYAADYADMAVFMRQERSCLQTEVYRLYQRILAGILTGNTDMHLKNFALFHTPAGLRLTPNYDQVAASVYKPYQYVALRLDGKLKAKHLVHLGQAFALSHDAIMMAVEDLAKHIEAAKDAVSRRKQARLTQAQLAVLSGVSKPTLIRFEQNQANITVQSAFAILGQLGLLR